MIGLKIQEASDLIEIGRVGENQRTAVTFNLSTEYPGADITVIHQRSGDPTGYPVNPENYSVNDGILTWIITSGDTGKRGIGAVEIVYTLNDVIMKSEIYRTVTLPALDSSEGPAPQPWTSWQQEIKGYADTAAAAAETATAAAETSSEAAETATSAIATVTEAADAAEQAKTDAEAAKQTAVAASETAVAAKDAILASIYFDGTTLVIGGGGV